MCSQIQARSSNNAMAFSAEQHHSISLKILVFKREIFTVYFKNTIV